MSSLRPAGFSDSEQSDSDDDFFAAPTNQEAAGANVTSAISLDNNCNETKKIVDPWRQGSNIEDGFHAIPAADSMDVDAFRRCVQDGDLEAIRNLFQQSEESNGLKKASYLRSDDLQGGVWASKVTFLAAENGRSEILKFLISEGASITRQAGNTILMAVCSANCTSFSSDTSVTESFENRLVQCAEVIFETLQGEETGEDKDTTTAAKQNMVNAVQSHGGMTGLMMAAREGHLKLVRFLVDKCGARIDAHDSQKWTALCFALDRGRGDVARHLLESGADPHVLTLEGQTLADLVPNKNQALRRIVEAFIKRKSSLADTDLAEAGVENDDICNLDGYTKFSELQSVLAEIEGAAEYFRVFEDHRVNLEHFLSLSETDLEKMGIEKVGVRKRLVQSICEIHKRDWDQSSVPKVQPKDRSSGVHFTCPEAVLMIANINKHFTFINANIRYLRKNIESHPGVLRLGQEVADVSALDIYVKKSRETLRATAQQLKTLDRTLGQFQGDPDYQPANRIQPPANSKTRVLRLLIVPTYLIGLPILAYSAYKYVSSK